MRESGCSDEDIKVADDLACMSEFSSQTCKLSHDGWFQGWVNNSDENHLLASNPAGVFSTSSMVHRSGSGDNTYQVVFNTPGTYSYSSTLVQRLNNQPEGMTSSATGTITVTP